MQSLIIEEGVFRYDKYRSQRHFHFFGGLPRWLIQHEGYSKSHLPDHPIIFEFKKALAGHPLSKIHDAVF